MHNCQKEKLLTTLDTIELPQTKPKDSSLGKQV